MRLLSAAQSRDLENATLGLGQVTQAGLLESAGTVIAQQVDLFLQHRKKARILFLIGPGNNGSDGLVAARLLKRRAYQRVQCQLIGAKDSPAELWQWQLQMAKNSGVEVFSHGPARLQVDISESDLLIDAIFGIGFHSKLPDIVSEVIEFVNSKNLPVIAVDAPTGLNVATGRENPVAFHCKKTLTFGCAKPGFFIAQGPRCAGQIQVFPLDFSKSMLRQFANQYFAWGARATQKVLPQRSPESNKSDSGSVYVFAGSADYPGAGILSALAAARSGAGYVYLLSPSDIYQKIPLAPEIIFRPYQDFNWKTLDQWDARKKEKTSFVVGPGLGVNEQTKKILQELRQRPWAKVVVDADALRVCVQEKFFPLPKTWIITPHTGELSGILQQSVQTVIQDRFASSQQAVALCECLVLAKGFRTIVADAEKSVVILSGNAALAKAGTGDVLSGMIAALRAQGLTPLMAACAGAYLHGRLADDWIREGKDVLSLLPTDLLANLAGLLGGLRRLGELRRLGKVALKS